MIDVKELEDYKVYQTSNYDLFKKLNGNRDVKNEKVIIKSIQKIGLIDNPIIVNEKYEVIDGQNRLKALQTLNMPVLFHVIPGLNIDDAINMNLGRTNWKMIDYAQSYAAQGIQDYQVLLDYHEITKLDLSTLFTIQKHACIHGGTYRSGSHQTNPIINGKYKLEGIEHDRLKRFIKYYPEVKDLLRHAQGETRCKVATFGYCLNCDGVDPVRLVKTYNKYCLDFVPYTKVSDSLMQISSYYNKSMKKAENKMFFDMEWRATGRNGGKI